MRDFLTTILPGGKWRTLLLLTAAFLAVLLLSSMLSELEFDYGEPVSLRRPSSPLSGLFRSGGGEALITCLLGFLALVPLLLPVALIYLLISKEAKKRVLRALLSLSWLIVFYIVIRNRANLFQDGGFQVPPLLPPGEDLASQLDLNVTPSPGFINLVTAGLAILVTASLAALALSLWRRWRRRDRINEGIVRQAKEALDSLGEGADLRDTIVRCYFEMSRTLRVQRGLRRARAMTPREFEASLSRTGLPLDQVSRLTRLFEAVRYGEKNLGESHKREATDCLASIVEASARDR
jgi:hypothetical protein